MADFGIFSYFLGRYFDTNSPHHPDFYNALGNKIHLTRDTNLIDDISSSHNNKSVLQTVKSPMSLKY